MDAHPSAHDWTMPSKRTHPWSLRLLAVTLAPQVLVLSSPVAARPPAACARDIATYCSNAPPETSERVLCLQLHEGQLTPECRQALKEKQSTGDTQRSQSKKAVRAWAAPCMNDIRALCKGIPAGHGRVAECLTQHQAQLSEPCKAAFAPKSN